METTYKEVIIIPKNANKRKREGYYKVYFQAKHKDLLKLWNFLDSLIEELGNPLKKKKTGRPPKFNDLKIYTKIGLLIGYFDFTLDEIAGILPLLTNETLDRSNH